MATFRSPEYTKVGTRFQLVSDIAVAMEIIANMLTDQPETIYRILTRAMHNVDIATGNISLVENTTYKTTGPSSSFEIKNKVPPFPEPTCYVLEILATCTDDQFESLLDGTAVVHDYIVIDNSSKSLFPNFNASSSNATGASAKGGAAGLEIISSSLAVVLGVAITLIL